MTIFVTSRKWFNRLEIEAFKSPGQPGRKEKKWQLKIMRLQPEYRIFAVLQ